MIIQYGSRRLFAENFKLENSLRKVCYPHVYVPSLFMLYFIFVLWARADFHQGTAKEATVDSSQVKEKGGKK